MRAGIMVFALLLAACGGQPVVTGGGAAGPGEFAATQSAAPTSAPSSALSGTIAQTPFGALVREAVLTSPTAMSNSATLRSATAGIDAARADYRPKVSLGAEMDHTGTVLPALTLSQLVYDGGQSRARLRAARMRAEQQREDQVAALSAETLSAFDAAISLRAARARVAEARANLTAHERLYAMVSERTYAGVGSTVDEGSADARLTAARSGLMEAEAAVTKATGDFRAAFGFAPPAQLPTIPDAPGFGRTDPARIIEASAQMRALRFAEQQQREVIEEIRAQRTPRLSVSVTSALGQRTYGNDVQGGLGVQMPVSTGGQIKANLAAAEQELAALQADQAALRRQLMNALENAMADLHSRKARLANARAAVSAARNAFEMARDQYTIGKVSVIRLLDTQKDLSAAELALIEVERETALDGYTILAVTGDILAAVGVNNPREALPAQPVTDAG
ncbi:TolC family protein [Sagittula sp. S175]|uniref:TolC family protein n=1 Tax=Sagittula sp. S175 TaxID=3415129 RepID=UPI003C7DF65D